ncbi:MAG: FkbM family methyltransferase [Chloroflexota bacterium]
MSFPEFIYTEILKPRPLKALANAVLLRIIPKTLRVGPATLHLDLSDPVVSGALALRVFEPSELAFFQEYCRGGMTLVDIGANVGLYTALAMRQLDATGRIVAFEPHPGSFAFLQKNVAANQADAQAGPPLRGQCRVEALNLAATPERGRRELRLNPENRGDNRLYQGTYQGKVEQWKTLPVEGRPVDDVLADLGIQQVNFVKIDIQGYEQNAISGFQETLARSENVILMTEFWPKGLREAGGDAIAYLTMLSDLGFTLYELKERPRGKATPLDDWEALIARLPERKYTNIIGVKGYTIRSG